MELDKQVVASKEIVPHPKKIIFLTWFWITRSEFGVNNSLSKKKDFVGVEQDPLDGFMQFMSICIWYYGEYVGDPPWFCRSYRV
jgi:hypothetical protein